MRVFSTILNSAVCISTLLFVSGGLSSISHAETSASSKADKCEGGGEISSAILINTTSKYCKCKGKDRLMGLEYTRIDSAGTDASCGSSARAGEVCAMSEIRVPGGVSEDSVPQYIDDYLNGALNNNKEPSQKCHSGLSCDFSPEECCVPETVAEFVKVDKVWLRGRRVGQSVSYTRQYVCSCKPVQH